MSSLGPGLALKSGMRKSIFIILSLTFSVSTFAFTEEALNSRFASWGVDPEKKEASIKVKEGWTKFKKNKDIVVAVIDTGIQWDHPYLKENIFVPKGEVSSSNFGADFSNSQSSFMPTDLHGHGTHIAGVVKSVHPGVKILAIKYHNPNASGEANLASTIKAIKYAIEQNVDIINYSAGGSTASLEELAVLKLAERKGILVVAAAGNEHSNIDDKRNAFYPASYGLSNIITVGAHDESLNIISASNFGRHSVDIAAPGLRIRGPIPGNGAAYMTGTSQATAFVTGVAALIKAKHPSMKYTQVKNIILSSSQRVRNFEGKIFGAGKLDAVGAMELADRSGVNRAVANQ